MHKMIILCGGKGVRLLPLTESIPKALVEVGGKPILKHIIDKYTEKNITNYILCIGYKGQAIRDFLSGSDNFTFVDSGEEASMLKRIYDTKDHVSDRAIVTYCDTLTNLNFDDLIQSHKQNDNFATIVLAKIKSPFGIVSHKNNKAHSFEEKPLMDYYIGTFVIEKEAFDLITSDLLEEKDGKGLVRFFQKLIELGKLGVYEYNDLQLTFNTNHEKDFVEKEIVKFYTLKEEYQNGR